MNASLKIIKPNIISIFAELGESINKKWLKYNYSEDLLPKIASDALMKACLHQHIVPEDVINLSLMNNSPISAHQVDSPFGDLQLITYKNTRFYIEVLYWCDGATAIHDHGFSGAFSVVSGSSINVVYDFEMTEKVNHHFWFGKLSNPRISMLTEGSVRTIYSGKRFIHSVFHLVNPTISVVVRTYQDDDAMPQFQYRGKKIGLLEEFLPDLAKKIQGLRFVLRSNQEKFILHFKQIYEYSPIDEKYWLLRAFYANIIKIPILHETFIFSDDAKIQSILECVEEEAILHKSLQIRSRIQDSEVKYFIALLLNLPSWNEVREFIVSNYSNNVNEVIDSCVSKLKLLGFKLPNHLNVPKKNNLPNFIAPITNENALYNLVYKKMVNK